MDLLEKIKDAGIVGCGGAGFPTHVKLACTVEYLIINAAECEPLLRTDRYLMIHKAKEIVSAADMVGELVHAGNIFIALKETYIKEADALTEAIRELNSPVKLFRLKNFYPAGDEQIMVLEVTGRTVPPSGIPLDVGAVVSNTATIFAVSDAARGRALTHKYLTVTGEVGRPVIVHAPLGASFSQCLSAAGGAGTSSYHVLAGGPLMGKFYTREEALKLVVTKTTSGFVIVPDDTALVRKRSLSPSTILRQAKMSCIQCSYCTQLCPRYLSGHPLKPHLIMRKLAYAADPADVLEEEQVKNALICSECGLCEAYACPMGLSPRRVNVYLKNLLREKKIRYEKPEGPFTSREERSGRRAPSKRIAARLEVDQYYDYEIDECVELTPGSVAVPLSQHIGAPAVPVVQEGDFVEAGSLIADIPEKALGARVHTGISGVVSCITDREIIISSRDRSGGDL